MLISGYHQPPCFDQTRPVFDPCSSCLTRSPNNVDCDICIAMLLYYYSFLLGSRPTAISFGQWQIIKNNKIICVLFTFVAHQFAAFADIYNLLLMLRWGCPYFTWCRQSEQRAVLYQIKSVGGAFFFLRACAAAMFGAAARFQLQSLLVRCLCAAQESRQMFQPVLLFGRRPVAGFRGVLTCDCVYLCWLMLRSAGLCVLKAVGLTRGFAANLFFQER